MSRRTKTEFDTHRNAVSRRRLLQMGAIGTVMGLAGCGSDGNGNGTDGDGDGGDGGSNGGDGGSNGGDGGSNGGDGGDGGSGGSPIDSTATLFTNAPPNNSHFNPYNPAQHAGFEQYYSIQLFAFNGNTNEYHSRLGSEFTLEDTTATIELDDSYSWQDGSAVTANDVANQFQIARMLDYPIWNRIESMEVPDDTTIVFEVDRPYSKNIIRSNLNRFIVVKEGSEWDQWIDLASQDLSDEEKSSAQEDLQSWNYAVEKGKTPAANGPLVLSERRSDGWLFEQNEHWPYEFNIPEYEFRQVTSDNGIWQMSIADEMDMASHHSVTADTKSQYPEHMEHFTLPANECIAPVLNHEHPVWGQREARKALAYLIDRERLIRNMNPRHSQLEQVSGYTDVLAEDILSENFRGQLEEYGVNSQPEKAAEMMRAAGMERVNGTWQTSEGETVTFEWMGARWPDATGIATTLGTHFEKFGVDFTDTTVSTSSWSQRKSQGDYTMTWHVTAGPGHPWFYTTNVLNPQILTQVSVPQETAELPPVGEPDGELEEFNLRQMQGDMAVAEGDDLQNYAEQFAWFINQALPVMPITNAGLSSLVTYDDWEFPETDADIMGIQFPPSQLLKETREGSNRTVLQAKTE
ncbi:hypothetical protein HZS55_14570 [Halosimplex rubrum]|uniref:Solute-binding protein family 5 domain-containing protein n=1 Tax=Halosimplex rubrum TaxID=869889 RepID=A0A7D5P171_9EURY|nr:ABC transporter substrate-binding protein [Halosimplex rubrum]QLH78443.1 hypothetical protein HZS55_14570 [Halosimplex rubrum]